jgi:aminoglycoside 6-adenylyltransferase
MRSEQQMLDLILTTAKEDDRIRAVIMNGSRANPNAPRDPFQDFDIVYLVTDIEPFKRNLDWIKRFGELMILQLPDDMQDPPPEDKISYAYLMQFTDGNRIDLTILPIKNLNAREKDSLSLLLLDKDNLIGSFPPANESGYLPKPPTAKQFADCCNEFWWVNPYVAKGLWRGEILYAKDLAEVTREEMMKMLRWYIGVKTRFSISPGKNGKYFEKYLEPDVWNTLMRTYSDESYEHTWDSLFTMGDLFRTTALHVAKHFGFDYPHGDDQKVTAHLKHVRSLPRDAKEIY